MNREKWLYVFLAVLFGLYVCVEYYAPKELDWTPTFLNKDKKPFGAFILFDRMGDLFDEEVSSSFRTLYELRDSTGQLFIHTMSFSPTIEEVDLLKRRLDSGYHVLIAAQTYSSSFMDSVGLDWEKKFNTKAVLFADSTEVSFAGYTGRYSTSLINSYFNLSDSTGWQVLASYRQPILVSKKLGKGNLILCSTPLLFTNFSILQDHRFAEFALTRLRNEQVLHTLYYHLGKLQPASPFRFLLSERALTWGLYIGLFTLLIFLLVNSQRRQRMVPVLDPLDNTTVQFIKTLGALFYRERDHGRAAIKLVSHFKNQLHRSFHRNPVFEESYYQFLSQKSGVEKTVVVRLFERISQLEHHPTLNEKQLEALYQDLRKFNFYQHE